MATEQNKVSFPFDLMIFAAIGFYICNILISMKTLDVTLGDTDNAMRLVQLRDYLGHGHWYDLSNHRLAPAEGYVSHWSRIPDFIMALIYKVALTFTSAKNAEWATLVLYPGLWFLPAFFALSWFSFKLVQQRLVVVAALIILVACATAFTQFVAGRIDHHNAQISLAFITIVATALMKEGKRYAIVAGLCSALLITIGLEALPFLFVSATAIGFRFIAFNREPVSTQVYAFSLGFGTLFGLISTFPPNQITKTACDAMAINYAAPVALGALMLGVWARSEKLNASQWTRFIGVGAAGISALALFAYLDPDCLKGPFAKLNPAVKPLWLNRVAEMQPVLTWSNVSENLSNLIFVYCIIPGAVATCWLLRKKTFRTNTAVLTIIAAFLVNAVLGLLNLRMSFYLPWFVAPVVCVAVFDWAQNVERKKWIVVFPIMAAFSPLALYLWLDPVLTKIFVPTTPQAVQTEEKSACFDTKNFDALAMLPQGFIMAELDLGPFILAHTHHSVAAAPYHRISNSILQTIEFFDVKTKDEARAIAVKEKVKYVVICNAVSGAQLGTPTVYLKQALQADEIPDWLSAVSIENGNPIQVYAVKP